MVNIFDKNFNFYKKVSFLSGLYELYDLNKDTTFVFYSEDEEVVKFIKDEDIVVVREVNEITLDTLLSKKIILVKYEDYDKIGTIISLYKKISKKMNKKFDFFGILE